MFRKLRSLDEAKRILKQNFTPKPVGVEQVPLSLAHNRVLAEDIVAPIDVPPFNRSTMDGYAVKAADTFGAEEDHPIALKLCGSVRVGETPKVTVEKGTTVEIVTGAPLPNGADAVVMLEYVVQKNNTIFTHRSVSKGENVMKAGSDIHKGEVILKKSQTLSSREIGVLAALGFAQVNVYKRPRVAIISTGAEIVEPGKPLSPGKIYDINAHTISAAVTECGGEPISLEIVPDETNQLKATLRKALDSADIIMTSGGVSVGPTDIIPKVLNTLGKPGVIVSGIAVKPGKPATIAIVDGKPVFSLPGHPTSSLLIFHILARSAILGMTGRREETPVTVKAVASAKMFPARGRRTFVMVSLTSDKSGGLVASPVALGLSGAITTLAKADGFVEIMERQQFINAGDEVTVHLFKPLRDVS
ncbi:MAG: gephyrin-like molybdotransferase Glp [Candidatus Bathyarchaeia archaeon]